jgi:hypothetical protein
VLVLAVRSSLMPTLCVPLGSTLLQALPAAQGCWSCRRPGAAGQPAASRRTSSSCSTKQLLLQLACAATAAAVPADAWIVAVTTRVIPPTAAASVEAAAAWRARQAGTCTHMHREGGWGVILNMLCH